MSRGIMALLTAFFLLAAQAGAVQVETTKTGGGGPVSIGNPLSDPGSQTGQMRQGLSAPGLVPALAAPVGPPGVSESKAGVSKPLPALSPEPVAPGPAVEAPAPPVLPNSVVTPVQAQAPQAGISPPAAPSQGPLTGPDNGPQETEKAAADNGGQTKAPPGPELIERAKATAENLTGQTGVVSPSPDVQAAQRYIRDIMGSRPPNQAETEALLQDFLDMRGLDPRSARAQAIRQVLLAPKLKAEAEAVAKLDPRYQGVGPYILEAAKEYGVTASQVQEAVAKRGLAGLLAGARSREQAERILDSVLARDRFDRFLTRYPRNAQGDLMRDVANNMLVRSGKSIEEVSRDGVFVYADFYGRGVTRTSVGRDPDPQSPNVLFYVRFEDNKWRIDVYRQNRGRGFQGGADSSFVEAFQQWLISGGVPRSDLLSR